MSEYAETTAKEQTTDQRARELPERIVIPPIKGEMVHLRPRHHRRHRTHGGH